MSIALALNNALSGMRASQRNISVLSNNIANANTDGYSRQTVDQTALYVEGEGSGVQVENVVRKVDKYLQKAVQENSSSMNSASVLNDYADRVQVLLGQPGSSNSLDSFTSTFFNNLQAMAETPDSVSLRSNVVQSASTLATQISQLAAGLQGLRQQADSDLKDAVSAINDQLKQLDNINAAIGRSQALGQSTAGLLDSRDAALGTLSQYMDLNIFYGSDGQVNVFTANGAALVDGNRHQVAYQPLQSDNGYGNNTPFGAFTVSTLNADGNMVGTPQTIISGGTSDQVTTKLTGGKLYGLEQVRDKVIPQILNEIDMFASRLRDETNRVQNMGSAFPPPTSLTGTRTVKPSDSSAWSGTVRIAVLNAQGNPVASPYADTASQGLPPLTLDLAALGANSGSADGTSSVQNIIDAINNYYGPPQVKTEVGALNNIQLVSNTTTMPSGTPPSFNFDFNLDNISNGSAQFFVSDVTVKDDAGFDITSVSNTAPQINLAATNTFQTYVGEDYFTVSTTGAANLQVGQTVQIPASALGSLPPTMGTLPSSNFTGYFTVKSISGNQVTLNLPINTFTNTAETVNSSGLQILPSYDTVAAGSNVRTKNGGSFTADLTSNPSSTYYDISMNVGVMGADGTIKNSVVTYRVPNNVANIKNNYFSSTSATLDGNRELPTSSQDSMRAILVDANGNELQKINGKYVDQPGYLKLVGNGSNTIAIDSLDSKQLGNQAIQPPDQGTGRGFSHYFELNNFFTSNKPTNNGDTVTGSALNFAVEKRILNNPNLVSTGILSATPQPSDPSVPRVYTYSLNSGDNTIAQQLAKVSSNGLSFDAAGGLAAANTSLNTYLGSLIGYVASQAASAQSDYSNSQTLYNGFKSRLDSATGVNLDEELANTIIYQNAYTASARIVKVTDELYKDLLDAIV